MSRVVTLLVRLVMVVLGSYLICGATCEAQPSLVNFDEPSEAKPDEASDYLLVNIRDSRRSSAENPFNNLPADTQLRKAQIVGLHVIIERQNANKIYERLDNAGNIEAVDIYAETLDIRSVIHLPGAKVRIFAKSLIFDSQSETASISTVPLAMQTAAQQFADGIDGLNGGDITVFAQSISGVGGDTKRFILSGGDGQDGGAGQSGVPGSANSRCIRVACNF
jgi:hypothetical protein